MNQSIFARIQSWFLLAKDSLIHWLNRIKPEVSGCYSVAKQGSKNAYERTRLRMMSPKRLDILFVVIASLLVMLDLFFRLRERLDITAYYYVFSTISQSLASAFAFLVAVAIYRMQTIENEMETALGEVIQHAAHGKDVNFLMRKNRCRSWEDMDQYIRQEHIDAIVGDEVKSLMSSNWRFFRQGRETLETLESELVRALQLTSIVIGSSIGLIPISQILKANQGYSSGSFMSMVFLYVVVFLACRCLWFYWDVAKHLTDRKPRDVYGSGEAISLSRVIAAGRATVSGATEPEWTGER